MHSLIFFFVLLPPTEQVTITFSQCSGRSKAAKRLTEEAAIIHSARRILQARSPQ